MNIIKDTVEFEKNFPLFAAVNRGARGKLFEDEANSFVHHEPDALDIARHQGRLIFLEYQGEGDVDSTALLVGKGITYDTGGLDIKST